MRNGWAKLEPEASGGNSRVGHLAGKSRAEEIRAPHGGPEGSRGQPAPDLEIRGSGWQVRIRGEDARFFPSEIYDDYAAFSEAEGSLLKSERRTRVRFLRRSVSNGAGEETRDFVIKLYRYPILPRLRTWLRRPKAEREFENLLALKDLGVGVVEPVGFGFERDRFGFVPSCFVITRYIKNSVHLHHWSRAIGDEGVRASRMTQDILREMGRTLRRIHCERFFLFSPKAKNILIHEGNGGLPQLLLMDVPYGRTFRRWPLDRWAQSRDIGLFLATFLPDADERMKAPFYEAYLPDPLGRSTEEFRREVRRATRVNQNRTFVSGLIHRTKRRLKRWRRNRARSGENSAKG